VPVGAPVEASACFAAGTTVASKGSGTLTLNHNAIASTSTTATILPWGNGDGSTTFNVPNLEGRTIAGRDNMSGTAAGTLTSTYYGAVPDALNVAGGAQSTTLVTLNLPAYTPTGSFTGSPGIVDPGHTHATNALLNNATSSTGGGAFPVPNPLAGSVSANTTGITANAGTLAFTANAQGGTSTPFSRVQPSITMDYIIKAFDVDATTTNLVVGVSTITGGSNTNILYDNNGILGEYALSTANQYNCATAGTLVQPSVVYQTETTTTYGTTTTFDFCTFKNTAVTLTGNITTQTFSNVVAGKAGMITFIQDGAGNHTTVWNAALKFTGGTAPTLTTTAGAVDILTYACRSPTFCGASLLTDVK
jgi:microcystin-dependent protein